MDGTYFTVQGIIDGKIEAICNQCKEIKRGLISSTGNFIAHYKSKHKSLVPIMEKYLKKSTSATAESTQSIAIDQQPKVSDMFAAKCTDDTV